MRELKKLIDFYNEKHQRIYNKLLFDLAQDIMKMLSDEELTQIYEANKEPFATISSMREEDILKRPDLIQRAIDIFSAHIENRPVTLNELRKMNLNELREYTASLIKNTDEKTLIEVNALKESLL